MRKRMCLLSLAVCWLGGAQAGRAAPPAETSCLGAGAKTRCSVDRRPWVVENGGGDWAIANPSPNDLRFEVRPGDVAAWDRQHSHPAERAEISESNQKQPLETDVWFSFGLMVEPGAPITSRWLVLGQLHPTEDPGDISPSPAWAQELGAGDDFRILVRTRADKPLRSNPGPLVVFDDPHFQRGKVYRFVYHLRYSLRHGLLEAWRDGREVVNYVGPLGYSGRQGPYFKFGIYREPAREALAVHYYDLRFGGRELR